MGVRKGVLADAPRGSPVQECMHELAAPSNEKAGCVGRVSVGGVTQGSMGNLTRFGSWPSLQTVAGGVLNCRSRGRQGGPMKRRRYCPDTFPNSRHDLSVGLEP